MIGRWMRCIRFGQRHTTAPQSGSREIRSQLWAGGRLRHLCRPPQRRVRAGTARTSQQVVLVGGAGGAGETVTCERGGKEVHAADVARAIQLLLNADNVAGQAYSCCDRYISEFEVATLAKQISGSAAAIVGEPKSPRHQIETGKLRALGMQFGGTELLQQTIGQLIAAAVAG